MKSSSARLLLSLVALYLIALPARAQSCDCPQGMEHLCRCNVLIDQPVAQQQLAYLERLMLAEFAEFLQESPIATVRVGWKSEMSLRGEAAQGFIDGDNIVLNPTLRRDEALMVLAHELGHAWQFSSRPDPDAVEDYLAEGFAEWVAFHLVRRAGLTEFSYRIKANPDPRYGDPFRWYWGLEQQYGSGAVISIMLNWIDRSGHRL